MRRGGTGALGLLGVEGVAGFMLGGREVLRGIVEGSSHSQMKIIIIYNKDRIP